MPPARQTASRSGRPTGTPTPGGPSNYFIVQLFVSFAEQPQTPMILRVDDTAPIREVVHQALAKYAETLAPAGPAAVPFAPPSSSADDYILRLAKGDGTPDRAAAPLDRDGVLREQGLLFPYMLVLTLDPNRDVSQMSLTEAYKDSLLRRQLNTTAASGSGSSSVLTMTGANGSSAFGTSSLPGAPASLPPRRGSPSQPLGATLSDGAEDSQQQQQQLASLELSEDVSVILAREAKTRQALERQRLTQEEVERRRQENVKRIELETRERDRRHLEDCERRERERRLRAQQQRKEEEQQALAQMEERHKVEMAKKLDLFMREEKQKELLDLQRRELEKQERERQRRSEALERERQRRLREREEEERRAKAEKQTLRESGRQQRADTSLDAIIGRLHEDIERDHYAREEMLALERMEREVYERELFEREYIAKVERQRNAQKEAEHLQKQQKDSRRQQQEADRQQALLEQQDRERQEEQARKEVWLANRRLEQERLARQMELTRLTQQDETERRLNSGVPSYLRQGVTVA